MNCVIIDDEPLALAVLEKYVRQTDGLELLRSFENAFEALYYIQTKAVDLVFLDIQMPKVNGFQFIKILKYPPKIIITTAYKEFAVKAFEHGVVDYLLKPIPYNRFLDSVVKAIDMPLASKTTTVHSTPSEERKYFFIKEKGLYLKVYEDQIYFLHGDRNYCTIHHKEGKLNVRGNLSFYGNHLSAKNFIRVHRSYYVALNHIHKYNADEIWIHGVCIPVGRTYRKTLMEFLTNKTLVVHSG